MTELANVQVLVQQAASMVERLDKGILTDTAVVEQMIQRAQTTLLGIVSTTGVMSPSVSRGSVSLTNSSSAALHAKRAEALLAECSLLASSVDRAKKRQAKELHAKTEREKLLSGLSSANYFNRANTDAELLGREENGLKHSRRKVQQLVEESGAVLSALRGQSQRVSGTNQKLAEMLEVLGVSNQTVLAIVKTNRVDAWIVYAGMALLLMLMWYLWFR